MATTTDLTSTKWGIDDVPVRLREWATDLIHPLPTDDAHERTLEIGSDVMCTLRLRDELVSRRHVQLVRHSAHGAHGAHWTGHRYSGSKNRIYVDQRQSENFELDPGVELRIGGVTLVVESPRLIALRAFLRRILGLTSARNEVVELALRAVRHAAFRRAPLVLCGTEDMTPIALALARHTHRDRPFITSTPTRSDGGENVRYPQNHVTGLAALAAARQGTVCVSEAHLPKDWEALTAALRRPDAPAQLVICAMRNPARLAARMWSAPIVVPRLATRNKRELTQVIDEYGAEAIESLGVALRFSVEDRVWVAKHAAGSLTEIEVGTRRLVALRATGNETRAAKLLGMSQGSMQEWLRRREAVPGFKVTTHD